MKFQYSLYVQQETYKANFQEALARIQQASSFQEIQDLAEKKSLLCFQNRKIYHKIKANPWYWLRIDIKMFLLFDEGKILIEGYDNFLKYIEKVVRTVANRWEIAGAFRCFIQ